MTTPLESAPRRGFKTSGRPFFELPITTIFAFGLLASSCVASMPFHCSSLSLMPSVTIFWKSAMPWASMRLRSASCRSSA